MSESEPQLRKRTPAAPAPAAAVAAAAAAQAEKPTARGRDPGVRAAQAAPALLDYYLVVALVLGGCCTNVLAYETLLQSAPRIGSALTFAQMAFIAALRLPAVLRRPRGAALPRLAPRAAPLRTWAAQVALLVAGSLLNNWAFAFAVPLPVQIVFRSAGLAVSMAFGRVFLRKRYSRTQVAAVALVSAGVVLATLARPNPAPAAHAPPPDPARYALGVAMLVASLLLTAALGVLQERTYTRYGPCWQEGVFYTHALALPLFLPLARSVNSGLAGLAAGPAPARAAGALALNLASQLVCVSGVNRLSSVSSVSTNLVLTARKALSLCLSVWWFGHGWSAQLGAGAALVFLGSALFSAGAGGGKAG